MKKQYVLFLFMGLPLLQGCKEAPIHNAITCLSTAPSTEEQYLSSMFDSCRIIKLETTDEALVGQYLGKVKKTQDAYYILCDCRYLLKFDLTGKFLQKMDRTGNGPGEYALFNNYDILSNGD
ncbi:MAG: 6-bladed beta-propeller, partial [Bacteroidales bacterium]|nr:6-bladed beta-propeller [Bacteroidales bacterium]